MNERIRELAEQAGIKITPMIIDGVEYDYEDVDMDGSGDLKKFAELIVKECIECADNVGKANLDSGYPNSTAHHVKQKIREHFGVEE